jgi:hypothetical protein
VSTEWVVTTSSERVALNEQRQGELTFTVTNPTGRADRAVFDVVPGDGADPAWFTVDEPQRSVRPTASVSYLVKAKIPTQVPAGEFAMQGRVYSADSAPEESSVLSGRVLFAVKAAEPPKPKGRPWWIWVVVGLIVVVLAVTIPVVLTRGSGTPETTPTTGPTGIVAVPDVTKLNPTDAANTLQAAGLVPKVRYRYDPRRIGQAEQSIPAGTQIAAGSTVEVMSFVDLKKPDLVTPAHTQHYPNGQPLTFTWKDADPFVKKWRIVVRPNTCFWLLPFTNPQSCNILTAVDEQVTTPSYTAVLRITKLPAGGVGVWHSGYIQWYVQAVDDYGAFGPASATFDLGAD